MIDQVPFLWLEVDQAPARERSSPGVLLCLDRGLSHAAFGRAVPRLTEERLLALASAAHRQFLSEALSPPVERRLRTCFKELPARGSLLHLCFMPSRNPPVMKVNVSLPKHTLASYLRRVEWPGSFSALKEVWKAIAPSLRTAKIDLTLSPTLSPKLGLEVHPFNTPVEGRRRVLEWLESEKLADRTLCEDLAAWHGAKRTGLRGKSTSVELDFGMKLVLGEGDSIRAKAYWQVACDSLAAGAGSHV